MIAGALEIQLRADVARIRQDMDAARSIIGSSMRDVERIMKGAAGVIAGAFTAAIGAISFDAIIKAATEAEKAALKLDAVIKATGQSAGMARDKIDALADSLAAVTQFDDEGFKHAAASIIRFGNVSGEQFERTLKASADLAAFMGTDVPAAADMLAKAMASPAQGIDRLQRTIGYLDEAQLKYIKTLVEMGDTVGAQNELLLILEGRLGGVAETMNSGYTKATNDAKKATSEFWEALGASSIIKGPTTSFLTFVADSFRDLKTIIESGDWVEKGLRLLAFAGGWRGVGNPVTSGAASGDSPEARAARDKAEADRIAGIHRDLANQAVEIERWQLDRIKKLREEAERERLRSLDRQQRALFERLEDEREAYEKFQKDVERILAKNEKAIEHLTVDLMIDIADAAGDAAGAGMKVFNDETRVAVSLWSQLGDIVGDFFADLIFNGKKAFESLRNLVKRLLADMIALFAKRWVLQMAGQGSVATQAGQGTLSGAANSLVGTGVGMAGEYLAGAAGFTGVGTWATFTGAASGAIPAAAIGAEAVAAGVGVNTFAAGAGSALSGVYSALAAIPVWGWIAMAVIAIGAWIAGKHKGGDKFGGSFFSGGAVPGTDNGRFFTPNQADSEVRQIVEATLTGYADFAGRLGGTAGAFTLGLGFDHDPAGTAQSRVSSGLYGAGGGLLYGRRDVSMDDKEVPAAIQLEARRAFVAMLQNTDLADALDELFDSVDVSGATLEQLNAVLAQALEMKAIIDVLALWNVEGLDIEALQAMNREGETLTQTLNGLAQAQANYYALFFTEEEQLARKTEELARVFATMGLELPTTRQGFRDMVDAALDLADGPLYRWLMEISSAVSDILPPLEDLDEGLEDVADTVTATTQLFAAAVGQIVSGVNDPLTLYAQGRPARQGLGNYLNGLLTGGNSALDPRQRLAEAQRQYEQLLGLAQGGDVNAMGQLSGAHGTVLQLLGSTYGTASSQYNDFFRTSFDDMARIAEVATLNERMAETAEKSFKVQTDMLDMLIQIRDGVYRTSQTMVEATEETTQAVKAGGARDMKSR